VSNNSTAYLDGSTAQGAITISPGSTWTSGYGSATYVQGTFNNQGNIPDQRGKRPEYELRTQRQHHLAGRRHHDPEQRNGEAYVYQSTGGLTLNNVNNTSRAMG